MTTPEERSAHARAAKKTPKSPNPWDRPEAPKTGDQDDGALYEAVGRALSEWERLEGRLAVLFSFLIGLDVPSEAAVRAYGSILAFQQRKVMLEHAAEVYFDLHPDAELQRLFDDALAYAEGFAGRRNDIAHGMVMSFFDRDRNTIFVMRPPVYNATKVWPGMGGPLTSTTRLKSIISDLVSMRPTEESIFSLGRSRQSMLHGAIQNLSNKPTGRSSV